MRCTPTVSLLIVLTLPIAVLSRPTTGLSALAPAQGDEAQRLCGLALFGRIEIAIERRLSGPKQTFSEQTFHNIRSATKSARRLAEQIGKCDFRSHRPVWTSGQRPRESTPSNPARRNRTHDASHEPGQGSCRADGVTAAAERKARTSHGNEPRRCGARHLLNHAGHR